ncbi:hypothetical protein Syun_024462 [Stephania yunnanensis]|uniref:EF-hand domain-containing protein n=1 Tax=Stephania yunnanensis TaxID=152371 RepID=A0AAP0I4F3_9MAGN
MESGMETAKLEDVERVFRRCDVDGDGKISAEDLRHCVGITGEGMSLSLEEAEAVVKSLDSDGDGLLGMEDFVRLMMGNKGEEEKEMKEAFRMYLMEGSEHITPKSLKRMLSRLGESRTVDECSLMISSFDLNGDGVLNFDEFMVMMQ